MSRADLIGAIALASAYAVGIRALVPVQTRAMAVLALLLAVLAGATWLVLSPGLARIQHLIRYRLRYADALKRRRWVLLNDAKGLAVKLRGQLREADTELRIAVRALDERERTIAEKDTELDRLYAFVRSRRRAMAKRLRRGRRK